MSVITMRFLRSFHGTIFKNSSRNQYCTRNTKHGTLEPVNLAYATFEGTLSASETHPYPLIVMHGLFGSKSNWNTLCKAYQQRTIPPRKVIALDSRNHGDSPHNPHHSYELLALDLKNFLDNLSIQKATLLGHSMGGRAAMLFALKYPEMVEKLLVIDMSPVSVSSDVSNMPIYVHALKSLNIPSNIPLSRARLAADLQLTESGIGDRGLRAFLLTNLIQKQDGSFDWRINLSALLMNMDNITRFPYEKGTAFYGPTLFIGGGASDYIRRSDIQGIKQIFPNSQIQYIDGAGHWLHSEKPTEFLKISLEFLNKPNN